MGNANALKICLVQSDLVWENPAANRTHFERLLASEAGKHDLIILPEMFTTGFSMEALNLAEAADGPTFQWMQEMAQELDAVLMGSLIVREGNAHFNRMLAVGPDALLAQYDKRHLFRMAEEEKHFQGGQERVVFELKGWRIAPMICYDLRFPIWARNVVDEGGRAAYDLLVYVANWPGVRASHWRSLLQARAIENQAFVAGVNRVGLDGKGFEYSGDSQLLDHMGNVLLSAQYQAQLLTATLEKEDLENWRGRFPLWRDADAQLFDWKFQD